MLLDLFNMTARCHSFTCLLLYCRIQCDLFFDCTHGLKLTFVQCMHTQWQTLHYTVCVRVLVYKIHLEPLPIWFYKVYMCNVLFWFPIIKQWASRMKIKLNMTFIDTLLMIGISHNNLQASCLSSYNASPVIMDRCRSLNSWPTWQLMVNHVRPHNFQCLKVGGPHPGAVCGSEEGCIFSLAQKEILSVTRRYGSPERQELFFFSAHPLRSIS